MRDCEANFGATLAQQSAATMSSAQLLTRLANESLQGEANRLLSPHLFSSISFPTPQTLLFDLLCTTQFKAKMLTLVSPLDLIFGPS